MRRVESIPAPAPPRVAAAPRTPGEVIVDIQRELSRRGFYDGELDGLYGPKTDAAIRDFEHAAGLKPSTQPNEALLQAIIRSPSNAAKSVSGTTSAPRPIEMGSENMIEPAGSNGLNVSANSASPYVVCRPQVGGLFVDIWPPRIGRDDRAV
jgi:peptidoglycan hydrolase-like protein with peptidoglycan-binding domain